MLLVSLQPTLAGSQRAVTVASAAPGRAGEHRLGLPWDVGALHAHVGSRRSSQRGSHQFARPSSAMIAGTTTIRTIVASSRIAVDSPRPVILTSGDGLATKLRNTTVMISAAEVITRPVPAMPRATDSALSPVASYASRMRESRNTS